MSLTVIKAFCCISYRTIAIKIPFFRNSQLPFSTSSSFVHALEYQLNILEWAPMFQPLVWSMLETPVLLATKDEISGHNSAIHEFSNGRRQPLCRWNLDDLPPPSPFILIKACSQLQNVSTAAGLSCLPQQLAFKRLSLPEPSLCSAASCALEIEDTMHRRIMCTGTQVHFHNPFKIWTRYS